MADDPWMAAMRCGDFATAWSISDEILTQRVRDRVDCSHWPRHEQFIWRGQPFDDAHVLVRCYHGLGDTIQFVRLLATLRRRARRVTLWAPHALIDLLSGIEGVDDLVPLHDGVPQVSFDVDMELMEVAHALRITASDLPGPIPYIHVERQRRVETDQALDVGITWRSGEWNAERSIPAGSLTTFDAMPNVRFHSLQFPHARLPFDAPPLACEAIHLMAQRMTQLDLIVSVDTMVAHLAGALGLPVLLLLPAVADWRWQAHRHDCDWYPTMQLLRQEESDWTDVLEAARAKILALRPVLIAARGRHSVCYRASSD